MTRHTVVLPFTSATYPNPSPVLSTIYRTLVSLPPASDHLTVLFSTPSSQGEQLYPLLRSNATANWDDFQAFLGKVYACLAAAQWTAGKVLMDVEVAFGGESGYSAQGEVTVLQGYEELAEYTNVVKCPALPSSSPLVPPSPRAGPSIVALGGTFDHLHAAHKLLLHLALFVSTQKLIVGVMADDLLKTKSHATELERLDQRITSVEAFLSRHGGVKSGQGVQMDVVEIQDAFGPTAWDDNIQALVVSQETFAGGQAVNKLRREKSLSELEMFVIDVIASALEGGDDGEIQPVDPEGEEETEMQGKIHVKVGNEVRTLDLSGEHDEKKLKALKMGSTDIRKWIVENKGS